VIPGSYSAVNHIYLNGVRIAAATPAGGAMYFLTDQVESVKVVVNDQGLPVSRTEYLPYGETWFQEGENGHTPKYNSQELDTESGLYFYNARHYDSEICRFVTADTIVDGVFDTQGWNRYMYVRGNPIRYMDPTGHAGTSVLDNCGNLYNDGKTVNVFGNEVGSCSGSASTDGSSEYVSGQGLVGNTNSGQGLTGSVGEQAAVSQTKEQVEGALQQVPEGNNSLSNNVPYIGNNILDISPPEDVREQMNGQRKPVEDGQITSGFYDKRVWKGKEINHGGLDIKGSDNVSDVNVKSATPGIVAEVGWEDPFDINKGFGYRVKIKSLDGEMTYYYGHLRADSSNLKVGQEIKAGDIIGIMGNTGASIGELPKSEPGRHLHFEIRDTKGNSIYPSEMVELYESSN
jgi:RHS repeat-associated protein